MADPPLPPPDPKRPFDWQRDAPEWGDDGLSDDLRGCLMVTVAALAVMVGLVLLYVTWH